jgi:[ribosomal protein S5]-alanine N-acetyltransferase
VSDQTAALVIETARLRLRFADERDAAAVARLMTPAVTGWLASWPFPVTEAFARERLAQMRDAMQKGHAVCFAIERLEDQAFMGSVMIFRSRDDATHGGLGYWLGEAYQRQGFMTEAATAAMAAAFDRLALSVIEAGAQPENAGSLAIMRRLGMRSVGSRMTWASGRGRNELCEYYAVTRAEFDAARFRDVVPR